MKTFRTLVIVLVLAAVGRAIGRRLGQSDQLTDSREHNLQIFRKAADAANRGFPKRLDDETTALRIDVTDSGIVNRYKTTLTFAQVVQTGMMEWLYPSLAQQTCANRSYKMAMDKGFTISYAYVDRDDNPAGTVTIRKWDCGRKWN